MQTYTEFIKSMYKKAASSWRELNDMSPEDAWNTFNDLTQSWAAMTQEEATKAATAFYEGITSDDLAKQTGHIWPAASQEFKDGVLSQFEDFSPEDRAEALKRMGISEETEAPAEPVVAEQGKTNTGKQWFAATNTGNLDQMKKNVTSPAPVFNGRRNVTGSPYYKPAKTPSTPTIKQTANTPQPDNLSKNMPESYSQYSSRVVTDKGPGQ